MVVRKRVGELGGLTRETIVVDLELKIAVATELRDNAQIYQSTDFAQSTGALISVLVSQLKNGNAVFQTDEPEQVSVRMT